jgi:hypothetical protein
MKITVQSTDERFSADFINWLKDYPRVEEGSTSIIVHDCEADYEKFRERVEHAKDT